MIDGAPERVRIAALLTCHNRREVTLRCVTQLATQHLPANHFLEVILVDDGSTDGTSEAIQDKFDSVTVIRGDGGLFWGGGMRAAFAKALSADYDFCLWVNDDVSLDGDATQKLLSVFVDQQQRREKDPIIVGALRGEFSGETSYGGWKSRSDLFPTRMDRMQASEAVETCDGMNGNFVLIPRAVALAVGNLDPIFRHSMGDFDYSLRARDLGHLAVVAPGTVGECGRNPPDEIIEHPAGNVLQAWRKLISVKYLPLKPWMTYHRRHGGFLWPLAFLSPYVNFWIRTVTCRFKGRKTIKV